MRVTFLPGIWPPDVGGPATHGPEFVRHLVARGHVPRVVTMGDGPATERPCPVETVSRRSPFPVRYGLLTARAARAAHRADVVYASATYAAAAAAATASRKPLVVKLVSDPAFERARRYGLFSGTLEEFQSADGPALTAVKRMRTAALSRARTVVVPSEYLARIADGFGLDRGRLLVVPNPAPDIAGRPAAEPRPNTFVFAGRVTVQKALGTAIDAIARVPEASLVVIGDGPERAELERRAKRLGLDGRVSFLGALRRDEVLAALGAAWAAVIPSEWENLPHAALEALAVGTPVVATNVGGIPELVHDDVNGLLVPPGSADAFAGALTRLVGEPGLRQRLAARAAPSVAGFSTDRVYGELVRVLEEAARS